MRKSRVSPAADVGFTLIELLVVMIVIGVLAAIAIPAFVSQRARAHDASTKSDVSVVGKEIVTYYVDGGAGLDLDLEVEPGRAVLSDDDGYYASINLTNGTALPTANPFANLEDENAWCISLMDPDGAIKDFSYSARTGLDTGTC